MTEEIEQLNRLILELTLKNSRTPYEVTLLNKYMHEKKEKERR